MALTPWKTLFRKYLSAIPIAILLWLAIACLEHVFGSSSIWDLLVDPIGVLMDFQETEPITMEKL